MEVAVGEGSIPSTAPNVAPWLAERVAAVPVEVVPTRVRQQPRKTERRTLAVVAVVPEPIRMGPLREGREAGVAPGLSSSVTPQGIQRVLLLSRAMLITEPCIGCCSGQTQAKALASGHHQLVLLRSTTSLPAVAVVVAGAGTTMAVSISVLPVVTVAAAVAVAAASFDPERPLFRPHRPSRPRWDPEVQVGPPALRLVHGQEGADLTGAQLLFLVCKVHLV